MWDITTGAKVLRFKDCHDSEEITTMSMDALGKRLITASRAGDVKVCTLLRHTTCSSLTKNLAIRLLVCFRNISSKVCYPLKIILFERLIWTGPFAMHRFGTI